MKGIGSPGQNQLASSFTKKLGGTYLDVRGTIHVGTNLNPHSTGTVKIVGIL